MVSNDSMQVDVMSRLYEVEAKGKTYVAFSTPHTLTCIKIDQILSIVCTTPFLSHTLMCIALHHTSFYRLNVPKPIHFTFCKHTDAFCVCTQSVQVNELTEVTHKASRWTLASGDLASVHSCVQTREKSGEDDKQEVSHFSGMEGTYIAIEAGRSDMCTPIVSQVLKYS